MMQEGAFWSYPFLTMLIFEIKKDSQIKHVLKNGNVLLGYYLSLIFRALNWEIEDTELQQYSKVDTQEVLLIYCAI